ncbi:Putative RNA-binding protein 3 [Tupaia chinensis]|uniref:Putative RNA-binding protein 3 n=1 Tax=Tupaia chinensis TaxID=246437 RepID=L9KZK3_TUPCH|nr:Putative RNA-binding protein 3 [Tupaia chinensis]
MEKGLECFQRMTKNEEDLGGSDELLQQTFLCDILMVSTMAAANVKSTATCYTLRQYQTHSSRLGILKRPQGISHEKFPGFGCTTISSELGTRFVGSQLLHRKQALEDHFSSFEPISEVVVLRDLETQWSWGLGFITFTIPEHASDAMRARHGEPLDSRQVCVDHTGQSARTPRGDTFGAHSYSREGKDQGYGSDSQPGGCGYGRSRDSSCRRQGRCDCYSGGNYRDNYGSRGEACTADAGTQGNTQGITPRTVLPNGCIYRIFQLHRNICFSTSVSIFELRSQGRLLKTF